MKTCLAILMSLFLGLNTFAQSDFIQINHNKVLGTLSFLDTASESPGSAPSFVQFIQGHLGDDAVFQKLVKDYSSLDLQTSIHRERYPEKRHPFTSTKDLLWISSANSSDITDFAQRSIGLLPPSDHSKLIKIIEAVAPYYDRLVWNTTTTKRQQIEQNLSPYKEQIAQLFKKVNAFLGSNWSPKIPFKIMLYPIPVAKGGTTAIPKGNNLICSYLSDREGEHVDLVGIAVHEMDHILYDAQPLDLQIQMDEWFTTSTNPYAPMAYDFFDEGLATAVGNGWAYEQINGKMDEGEWYNFEYIDGFGKKLYPLVKSYIDAAKTIDKQFVDSAITLFGDAFPKATLDLDILMNNVNILSQSEDEARIDGYFVGIRKHFRMRSAYFSSPMQDEKSIERFRESKRTKLVLLDENNEEMLSFLATQFKDFPQNIDTDKSFVTSFYDENAESTVILMNLIETSDYLPLMDKLKAEKYVVYRKIIHLK